MANIFASFLIRLSTKAEISDFHHAFMDAVNARRVEPYDRVAVCNSAIVLDRQIARTFAIIGEPGQEMTQQGKADNELWDQWRTKRMTNWIKTVGAQITRPYDEDAFGIYLRTIAVAAEATEHGHAARSNFLLTQTYAGLLPVASLCSKGDTGKNAPALDVYMDRLGQVWNAAAMYEGHKESMAKELRARMTVNNQHGLWGIEPEPRFGHHRTAILRLIRT